MENTRFSQALAGYSLKILKSWKVELYLVLAWILHEGDTIILINAWFFIMLQEKI